MFCRFCSMIFFANKIFLQRILFTFAQNFWKVSFFRRNINAILGTVAFHLIVICVCLACKIGVIQKEPESYIIIDPQDFEMEDKSQSSETEEDMMTDEQIDQYLQKLGIAGSNYSGTRTYQPSSGQTMSEDDMRAMYEETFLREKYGDDYNDAQNRTYEDYIDQSRMGQYQSNSQPRNMVKSGPALVYAELDNKQREASYLHVPVFTCEGSGVVVVRISLASSGKVSSAEVVSSNLTADSECLTNAARTAALKSSFSKISGNKTEGGKITYTFVKQ